MTNTKKIILIGTLPPPLDGQSVAFKVLVDYFKSNAVDSKVINISHNKLRNGLTSPPGIFRYADYSFVLLELLYFSLIGYRTVYLQIAQSERGFLRDKWICKIAKKFNSRIIAHLHGGNYDGFYRSLSPSTQQEVKKYLQSLDAMIVLSENLKKMFDFEPALTSKLYVVSNGAGSKKTLPVIKEPVNRLIKIIYLSNLVETKGYLQVLEAVRILVKENGVPVVANFCGRFHVDSDKTQFVTEAEAQQHFLKKISDYQLEENVHYKGIVSGVEKQLLLEEAHFFVLPTSYVNEGQPISILEAMGAGCVVLASNYRAIPEMIQHKCNGYLLERGSAQEIAGHIYENYQDVEKFRQISTNAFNTFNEKYTETVHCANLLKVINEVVAKGS